MSELLLAERTVRVELTDDEIVLLDGRCRPETQEAVEAAKERIAAREQHPDLPPVLASFVATVVAEARTNGKLIFQHTRLSHCPLCASDPGFVAYKSGPRKGQPNYSRKRKLSGYDLADRFVRVEGYASVGGCSDCIDTVLPTLQEALRGVPAQVPDALRADGEPQRVKYPNRLCTACDWEGHEGEMRKLPAVFGGSYPGGCPSCPAENKPFGPRIIESVNGFVVVEQSA